MGNLHNEILRKEPWKPRIRKRNPILGAINWERHKAKLAAKRKIKNRIARKTRRTQYRAS